MERNPMPPLAIVGIHREPNEHSVGPSVFDIVYHCILGRVIPKISTAYVL
jgi:hypothetical protein